MTEILPLLLCVQPALDATLTRQLAGIITALLTMTGRVTMLGMARWGERGSSSRTVQRFFHASVPWLQVGWQFFQQHLGDADDTYLLAGDETVVTKSGKTTHGLERFFSSLVQKAVPSVAFFVLSLVRVKRRRSYPLLSRQVVRTAAERAAAAARCQPKKGAPAKKTGGQRGRPRGSKKVAGVELPLNAELLRVQGWVRLVVEVVQDGTGLLDGGRRRRCEMGCHRFPVCFQDTLRAVKVDFLPGHHAARAILVPIVGQRATTDAQPTRDGCTRHVLTHQIEGFHFPLHARMRMMKALVL